MCPSWNQILATPLLRTYRWVARGTFAGNTVLIQLCFDSETAERHKELVLLAQLHVYSPTKQANTHGRNNRVVKVQGAVSQGAPPAVRQKL